MASVLIIVADSATESLIGECVAFAGHHPVYDYTSGVAGESIRRTRPDVTLLDASLPVALLRACLGASDEVGSEAVWMSGTAKPVDLDDDRAEQCASFALSDGPEPLALIVARAVMHKQRRAIIDLESVCQPPQSLHGLRRFG